ncbi:kinesin-like protein KIN-4A isoform X2 [Selaginella moellendorffii]|uniref:kinesin-like protein KIN-4A isoform X2 n=1 Tax=Selaginella moellendorffii TaxID=88036 RepID=UPI000D1C365C|nr:kinesin-like protein KIN-4A isoform X2 [Selaginella moellendorffii]|eukprot:XP_024543548.1 kinesin-like protein KIN-4A isoform X2 [Selaginella moellendorffii]
MDSGKPPLAGVKDAVQVAVNIRPLIGSELLQGCRDCINVVAGEPQIQLGTHCFTFDYVYGTTTESSSSKIFKECVAPLVDGLFYGYNATVLAYGQTGSGKTYTMGTGYTPGGNNGGVIPQVMEKIFNKAHHLRNQTHFHIRVSFIEILKEEIHDLLCETTVTKQDTSGMKTPLLTRPSIQIRESTAGEINLAGITETDVHTLQEMASCLAQGSLSRATGSTNMNSRSSRSHAIFTITLEQKKKHREKSSSSFDAACDDFLCGKLHLVDLAGSERAKRTGTDGMRFKEGVHINKGLLALGNVISVLGEDKRRKEPRHVPYRDSKLTRLLQDSLGGNSRTVMIACISPADSNVEETLNTLKYANRARNIQNKPIVNRDPIGTEMQKLRQQLNLLQAELVCARASECAPTVLEVLKQKLSSLETSNEKLRRELMESQESCNSLCQRALDAQVERDRLLQVVERRPTSGYDEHTAEPTSLLQSYMRTIHDLEAELQLLRTSCSGDVRRVSTSSDGGCSDIVDGNHDVFEEDAMTAKEVEHHLFLRECMDKELQELNMQLKEKEAEMTRVANNDAAVLKDHFDKKILELEEEKKKLQMEKKLLSSELESLHSSSDEQTKRIQSSYAQKLKDLETQISDLKKQQEKHAQLLRLKQRSDDSAQRLENEIHRIKQQKVHLQNRIKQESEHFRTWKACREKELMRLRKEGRRNEYEMHKLQTLHERQKQVLHRKTEEAATASRRLKEVLESRKQEARENHVSGTPAKLTAKTFQQWFDNELESAVRLREARLAYEKQNAFQEGDARSDAQNAPTSPCDTEAPSVSSFSNGRIDSLERTSTAITISTTAVDLEEEQYRVRGPVRWQQVRTLGDAKDLLNFVFNVAACARCQLGDREHENKELNEKINLLLDELRQTECQKKQLEELMPRTTNNTGVSDAHADELLRLDIGGLLEEQVMSFSNPDELGDGACQSIEPNPESSGRTWKWRKSGTQKWPLQFKWKWQKPWRIAQWTQKNEKAIRPASSALRVLDMI